MGVNFNRADFGRRDNFRREFKIFLRAAEFFLRRRIKLDNLRGRVLLRGVKSSNLRGAGASQHVSFNADEFSLRNIFFHSRIAARRALRDRNFAAHPHEPTFARRLQLAVDFNFGGVRDFRAVAGDTLV